MQVQAVNLNHSQLALQLPGHHATHNISCNHTPAFFHAKNHPSLEKAEEYGPNLVKYTLKYCVTFFD